MPLKQQLSKSTTSLLVIVTGLVLLIGFAIWSYMRLLESQSWSEHTYEVLTHISELESLMLSDRGLSLCVATGDARLTEKPGWEKRLDTQLNLLKQLTADNPVQHSNVLNIEKRMRDWQLEYVFPAQRACEQARTGAHRADLAFQLAGIAERHHRDIGQLIGYVSESEQALLTVRQSNNRTTQRVTNLLLLLGMLSLAMLILVFLRTQLRSARELQQANQQLQHTLTAQTQIQADLAAAEARASAIVDNVSDAIVILNTEGRIGSFNRAAERIFGHREQDIRERNLLMLFPPDQEVLAMQDFLAFEADAEACALGTVDYEMEGLRRNGVRFPLELSISQMRVNDTLYLIALMRDVTERKRVEKMKNEFVSTVSHELRTPLTAIRGALGLVSGTMTADIPASMRSLVEIATSNSERLVRLINDILDIEKIESGHMRFDLSVQTLSKLLEQAVQANRHYAEQFGVTLHVRPPVPGCELRVDADRFMQLMANLLSNAAKFSPPGQQVDIEASVQGQDVVVKVIDRGAGIPANFRDKIFQKFSQADSSDTRAKGGTGLGLSICKAIVEQMGGSMGFDSVEGKGTTMHFSLPLLRQLELPVQQPVSRDSARLLVCEDDPDIASLLQMILRQADFNVDVAHDADTAMRMLLDGNYSALTLDIALPGKDGLSLLHELQQHEKTRALRVVVVSAKAAEARASLLRTSQEAEQGMVVDWLEKPIDQARLLRSIGVARQDASGPLRVLHVEDDADIRTVVGAMLAGKCELKAAATLAEAYQCCASGSFDVIILDQGLPDGSGLDLLSYLASHGITTPVVVFSANEVDDPDAVSASLVKSRTSDQQLLDTILGLAQTGRQ
ncbi:response regulator [Methylobacillus flagellatus]|uniref:response regulator n=1 Tax=Methylobacillus flagellatus TaxID=405 RepID=UPI0010F5239D|nr:response regulator [Methylobacillus flagellatus]